MKSARAQTPFVLLQAIPFAGPTRRADSGRTAFRSGRQNVAETGIRLSSCVPLGVRGSRISVLSPSRARLRDSCRGSLDVLTKMSLGNCCCPPAFWCLHDKRRPAPLKHATPHRRDGFSHRESDIGLFQRPIHTSGLSFWVSLRSWKCSTQWPEPSSSTIPRMSRAFTFWPLATRTDERLQ